MEWHYRANESLAIADDKRKESLENGAFEDAFLRETE
jgi:hypothetical protein